MRTAISLPSLILWLIAVPCFAEPVLDSASEPPPEFYEVMQKLMHWRDSLESLKIEYTWNNPYLDNTFQVSQSGKNPTPLHRSHMHWQDWWIGANTQQLKIRSKAESPTPYLFRTESGQSGKYEYFAEFNQSGLHPRYISIIDTGTRRTLQQIEQLPLYPVFFAINGWFSGAFENSPAEYVGTKEVDGAFCIGIAHSHPSVRIMWLDLKHDGLPRLIDPSGGSNDWLWRCDEFMQTNTGKWFPKRGEFGFEDRSSVRFEVKNVTMNGTIPSFRFRLPTITQQTIVRDMTKEGCHLPIIVNSASPSIPASVWWRLHCGFAILLGCTVWLAIHRTQGIVADDCTIGQGEGVLAVIR